MCAKFNILKKKSHLTTCHAQILANDQKPKDTQLLILHSPIEKRTKEKEKEKLASQRAHQTMASLATLAVVQPATINGLAGSSFTGAKLPVKATRETLRPKNMR